MWDIENSSLKSAQSIWRSSLESPKKNQVILIFEEHCTECSIPDCYTTCLLYSPREDNSCRRFEKGIFFNNEVCGYEISFKRWAKLEGQILGVSSSPIKLRIIESIYRGVVCLVKLNGESHDVIHATGNIKQMFYPRSALKYCQVLPLLESGCVEEYKFTLEEISVMCASHGKIYSLLLIININKCLLIHV